MSSLYHIDTIDNRLKSGSLLKIAQKYSDKQIKRNVNLNKPLDHPQVKRLQSPKHAALLKELNDTYTIAMTWL
ncbi:hypothetical protein CcaCcLH18_11973 [Colletotrichum camelliae]|nr:hypothetical protein CcaCcLH18_11973 [Colletotrichum camelliae]